MTPVPLSFSLLAPSPILAQDTDIGSILLWSLLLVVFLVIMFGGITMFRKWMTQPEDDEAVPKTGFTLGDLRRLHDVGNLSDEEFEKARVQMIAATQRASARAAEAAALAIKERGTAAGSTDVDAIRRRAKLHREQAQAKPPPPPDSGTSTPPLPPQ